MAPEGPVRRCPSSPHGTSGAAPEALTGRLGQLSPAHRRGTRVVESYEVERAVTRLGWFVIEKVFRGGNRREALRAGMRTTLERLRAVAEAGNRATR